MKQAILIATFAALCGAQTTVNGGRTFQGTLTSAGSVSAVDFSGAGSTAPVKVGTTASRATACTQGQFYFATDATAGQNLSFCTTTGTPGVWTQMSGGGGSTTTTSGAGSPSGSCTPPAIYIDTTNQLLWFCPATNTWKKPVPDTALFPTLAGPNTWTANNTLASGQLTATGGVAVVDFTSAASTVPAKTGLTASRPTACAQGQVYFASDAAAGQNLYFCTTTGSPGTWTQMSGATIATTGSGSPAGSCTPPAVYIDTTNQLLWFCAATNTWKKPVPDTTVFPTLAGSNTWTGYNNAATGQWRPPESTVSSLPAAASNSGKVFIVTDAASAGSCTTGGGSTREICRSNGTNYECVGNCGSSGSGGGSPGGSSGTMQVNNSGSFGGQAFVLTGGAFQRGVECATGTTSYTALTANAVSQEVTIVSAIPQKFRFSHMLVQEATQFAAAGVSTLTVSAGRAGVDTDVLPAFALKQATAPQNYWFDRPGVPIIGTGTYDLVLQFVGSSALGTGSASNFTAGAISWEVCGFSVQ